MTIEERIQRINARDEQCKKSTNELIDKHNMAYKIKDCEGNIFCLGGIENGIPFYRGIGGSKHIFDLAGYTVLEKYLA